MKSKKGLIIVAVTLLTMAFLLPVYAQSQSGILQQDRDRECEPEGPATRTYGENAQNPEEDLATSEENSEQTQITEQLRECNCENEDCEQYQYQYQYHYQYRYGQEEQD